MRRVVGVAGWGVPMTAEWFEELSPGTIVGDSGMHGRGIRFGVVLAPEPSERVRRIIDRDPAVWRPAVEEAVQVALKLRGFTR
jgi:hypothetical protein